MAPWWNRQQMFYEQALAKGKGFSKGTSFPPGPQGAQVAQGAQAQVHATTPSTVPGGASVMADAWTTGTIRRLFVGKGFGFIARDDLPTNGGRGDVFLHFSDLEAGVTSADLAVGMRMRFRWEASRDSRGPGGRARLVSFAMSENATLSTPAPVSTAPRRAARTGRVYRKELVLTMQQLLKSGGEFDERRPFGSRSRVGPLPTGIKFPFTIKMPKWYWDMEDERALAEANDDQRVQFIEARLDLENGADANNPETFGEGWALESWSYEDALAANQRLARAYNPPAASVQSQWAGSLPEFFQPVVLQ